MSEAAGFQAVTASSHASLVFVGPAIAIPAIPAKVPASFFSTFAAFAAFAIAASTETGFVRNRARRAAEDPKDRKNPRKGQRLLRMHGYKLNEEGAQEVAELRDKFPLVDDGYRIKEAFYAIWDAKSRTEAEGKFKEWKASIPSTQDEFKSLAREITRWHKEVFNYFDCGVTNAVTENYNGLIKMVNRMGRGYDFDILRAKVLLAPPLTGKVCKLCKQNAAVATFGPVPITGWAGDTDSGFEMDLCGSCHYLWHKFYIPMKKSMVESGMTYD